MTTIAGPFTSNVHERLSGRSPNARGKQIESKIEANLADAENRYTAALSSKADAARSHNERVSMVVGFMKEGERRALMEVRAHAAPAQQLTPATRTRAQ